MNERYYCITLELPDGKNFFTGIGRYVKILVPSWDTDINFAFITNSRIKIEHIHSKLSKLEGSNECIISEIIFNKDKKIFIV